MKKSSKKLSFTFERTLPASPEEAFDAWLNPKIPGTPWSMADKLLLTPQVDGFFYWLIDGTAHYGRFTKVDRPGRLEHTWMSPNTLGEETHVAVTFKKLGKETLMTLTHTGLPDVPAARGHEQGWNFFLDGFAKGIAAPSKKKR